jgi:ABC-type polysaccharide/polyol phosphate transport system ATPase subunit
MAAYAITAESLGKSYRIGDVDRRSRSLKDALAAAATAPLRNLRRLRGLSEVGTDEANIIWALRDVTFQLTHGEALGVIGRNGAGKSTLLKVLARITRPTTGRARIVGRAGALLEVGTGFNMELTGRDNVYLNGSILGMKRAHISRRFDEIVDFAGVERFIDTPVKRYSSGMYLRLAFAVAAHLEPDILIVDEVLAVGDAEFQEKCLSRMNDVAREGRTVLFVSHNLSAVQRLCGRSILLDKGRVIADGDTSHVIKQYIAFGGSDAPETWIDLSSMRRGGSGLARFVAASYAAGDGRAAPCPGGSLELRARIRAETPLSRVTIGFTIRDQYGTILMSGSTGALGAPAALPEGFSSWLFHIPSLCLRPGAYHVDLWVGDPIGASHDDVEPALRFDVIEHETRKLGPPFDPRYDGPVLCEYQASAIDNEEGPVGRKGRHAIGASVPQP